MREMRVALVLGLFLATASTSSEYPPILASTSFPETMDYFHCLLAAQVVEQHFPKLCEDVEYVSRR
jgi:hypothetical protein